MHIKQVIIEGFKSYKEQIATEQFSPKVNCVVGANGSGKTNFFHAIRFVLSDLFHNLRPEDRQALLHEGAGKQVISAFVEIVFDNSDNRIPVDKEEVCLRRTIGQKKDEYFLDKKHVTKTEVMNLLESAGFSRSNPYYVVQQGKIASLTLMKDSERLDLLKEIGGTRVYEERRRESLKIMQETGNKRKQIIQVVQYLEDRLKELDEEKEELKKYQQLDKQRRSLEYTIFDKELHETRSKLVEVEENRSRVSEKSASMHNEVSKAHEDLKKCEKEIKFLMKDSQTLSKEKETIEMQRTEAIKIHAQLELDVKDIEEKIASETRLQEEAKRDLKILEGEIQKSLKELEEIRPIYIARGNEEEEIAKKIMEREKRLSILYQKQGRATQFSSKSARDKWLQKEVNDLQSVLSTNLSLWKKESDLSTEIDKLSTEVAKAEKSLDHATPGDIRRGLNSVRRICRAHRITGVHGPIFELLDCEEKFFTAVEVTAGNSLFHVVVDTDDTSAKIIRILTAEKGGRVTFIPLNRVKGPHVTYPQSSDVVPLLKKLKFSSIFSPAFAQVFGRTVVCRDLDVATKVARSNGLDCITLEGDQVSKKGGMTGGFYDYRHSKLKLIKSIRQNVASINSKQEDLEKVRNAIQEIDQDITRLVTEQQKVDAKLGHQKSELEQIKHDIYNAKKQKQSACDTLEKKRKLLGTCESHITQLRAGMSIKVAEMKTDLVDQLTPEERDDLSRLNPEITELKEQLVACKTTRIEVETRKGEIETNLSTNLVRRQEELKAMISSESLKALSLEIEQKRTELNHAKVSVSDVTKQYNSIIENVEKTTRSINGIKTEKERLKAVEDNYQRTIQDEAKMSEQLVNKRNILTSKQEDYMKKIRDLGSLPSDAFEKYKRKNIKELHKMLHRCNEELKQFSHVNKKALDQYVNFTEQREELQKRQAELDAGDEKIRELISVLDQRKDESIERTFKGVAKNFREAFAELVQGGYGSLVMMKKKDGELGDDDYDEDGTRGADPEGRVEKYIGVKVKVSFTGQGETQSMKQLSGGQKTVVALALIFAIQRCDPAPFYLFDEIDAALDPQYRTAVGNMIRRQADAANTQFITTTFRPELVKVADKIYGVSHVHRVSRVNVVSREEALKFIELDQNQQND
ncbi:unnamed protein product [Victoria cruziana]